ncbi:MAG: Stp1/IreP family PP2C-type Ser/Thr phosphatase [Gammaproteobacteria bacterium]|nr:Stp1/IreP family PP2C-type Ser/Thr phosphatase [Gammaproteobacteria bacterium]
MSVSQKIETFALSDSGAKRTHNEDSVATDTRIGLAVVADGMGGYKGGEVASALAVNTIMSELESSLKRRREETADDNDEFSPESLAVKDVLELSNTIIYNAAQSQPQYGGMGTTVVLTLFYDNRMTIAHVGDSRLYRLRDDKLELVTEDHTLLRELIARGFYSEEEAKESQNKNLVTRALGIEPEVVIDIQEDVALPGDVYLLCSDGLNDMVEDRDIYLTLKQYNDNLDKAVAELIQLAKNNGGKDNVSVVLARPARGSSSPKNWAEKVVDWFF